MKAEAVKNISQLIFQMILHSVGVSCLYFHVVLSEFMTEAILAVILLSVMNVVFHSTSPLSLKKRAHQMAYVPKRIHCTVLKYPTIATLNCTPSHVHHMALTTSLI